MQERIVFLITLCLSFVGMLVAQDARDIVKRADERAKGKSSETDMTILIVRPSWTREMTMKTWTKGNDLALILITSPAKDKGTVFLKRDKEVWNWLPSIDRNIKLPPSMMNQSWMGTDFTNDDLVKEASIAEDYEHRFIGNEMVLDRSCYVIEMIPKPEAAIVWGKVVIWIDKKDLLMLRAEYYDEENILINTLVAADITMLGGKLLPSRLEMIPADKKGHKTILTYHALVFDRVISDDFFSPQNMPRVK